MPSFESSPATFTWISTSGAGFCPSRRSADSDAIEWISRTFGATSLTFRLWSWPMKSQVNRSPCASCFASRSWARFSPTSSMPASASAGRSAASTYLTAARISMSGPICSRTDSSLRRTCSESIAHDDARLAAGHATVAPVREIQLGLAAGAAVHVLDLGHARRGELRGYDDPEVEHAAGHRPVDVRERLEHLLPPLVAAAADPGADRGGRRRREAGERLLDDPAGQR